MRTVAAVRGAAFGGGFELALSCDFMVVADNAVFRCIEVTTGFIPIAGGLQRLAERVGRSRASRFAMLGEPYLARSRATSVLRPMWWRLKTQRPNLRRLSQMVRREPLQRCALC